MGHAIGSWPRVSQISSEWPGVSRCGLRLEIAPPNGGEATTVRCELKRAHRGRHKASFEGAFGAAAVLTFEGEVVD